MVLLTALAVLTVASAPRSVILAIRASEVVYFREKDDQGQYADVWIRKDEAWAGSKGDYEFRLYEWDNYGGYPSRRDEWRKKGTTAWQKHETGDPFLDPAALEVMRWSRNPEHYGYGSTDDGSPFSGFRWKRKPVKTRSFWWSLGEPSQNSWNLIIDAKTGRPYLTIKRSWELGSNKTYQPERTYFAEVQPHATWPKWASSSADEKD